MAYISKERPILILGTNGNLGSQITIQLKEKFKDCVVAWARNDCNTYIKFIWPTWYKRLF